MTDYPKCLYRDGGSYEWDGRLYDILAVDDADAEKKAKAEGWKTSDQVLDTPPDAEKPVPTRKVKRKGG